MNGYNMGSRRTRHATDQGLLPSNYPPDQIGKRALRQQVESAAKTPDSKDSAELLRREGRYAWDKLVWLKAQSRPDNDERERSAVATMVLSWAVLRKDLTLANRVRTGGEEGHRLAHGSPDETAARHLEILAWWAGYKRRTGLAGCKLSDEEILRRQGLGVRLSNGKTVRVSGRTLSRILNDEKYANEKIRLLNSQ